MNSSHPSSSSCSTRADCLSLIDPSWELIDPTPDIHILFLQFDKEFFQSFLSGCEVKWSARMTSCAGICVYEGRGGLCSIRLSKPLLSLRPRRDLIQTLLHEMIHAYLFVTVRDRDRDGHGVDFQSHMHRINHRAGTKITIYHSFHAEVSNYQQHWWRCSGSCRDRKPFYGWVKRASNRSPGPNDLWWNDHKNSCNGEFIKVKEPEGYEKGKRVKNGKTSSSDGSTTAMTIAKRVDDHQTTLDRFFSPSPKKQRIIAQSDHYPISTAGSNHHPFPIAGSDHHPIPIVESVHHPTAYSFPGRGHRLGDSQPVITITDSPEESVPCPVCSVMINVINGQWNIVYGRNVTISCRPGKRIGQLVERGRCDEVCLSSE